VSRLRFALLLAGLVGLYFLAGWVGLEFFGLLHPSASPVWPPTGVAIAALILFGYRVWPAIFVGAFLVNVTTAGSILTSLGIATGNTLEGVAAAYLVNRFAGGRHVFDHALDICKFVGLAAILSTAISATIGLGSLVLGGDTEPGQLGAIWFTWWLGDAVGTILVAPLLMLWYLDHNLRAPPKRLLETSLLFLAVLVTTSMLLFHPLLAPYPLASLCLPLLVWAAFRFRQREVVTAAALISVIATWATATGSGPFVMTTPNESLLVSQSFTAMIVITGLVMAALVQERVALLQRERAALAAAESALRSGDVFLAMLSHELRNPLSAIAAATSVLEESDVPADVAVRARRIIQRQTALFTRLIDDLLDVARISVRKMTLRKQPMDLAEAVESAVQAALPRNDPELPSVQLQLARVWVDADPDRLNQILANLIHNATKYTSPEGSIRIQTLAQDGDAVVRIEDSGTGIDAELLPHVFDLFAQGEQGPDRPHGGLGVGLTLVRMLAELHGGRVEAYSEGPGRGSAFVVRLPRASPPSGRHRMRERRSPTFGTYRILVVEDNADARESLRMVLESAGHEVHEAADGESGVERALELEPHVALIDIGLPGIDGCEVARRIKAANGAILLVALTGYGRDEDRIRSNEAGFDAHLVKPVAVNGLQEVIDGLVARAPADVDS
jgi:signal transduction histidine kinase/ActR/RegA family two-component response regulator